MSGNAIGLFLSPMSSSPECPVTTPGLNQNLSLKWHGTTALGHHWGLGLVNQWDFSDISYRFSAGKLSHGLFRSRTVTSALQATFVPGQ